MGHHQCRWNYDSQEDVLGVTAGFDRAGIPLDVVWLDIEWTGKGHRYFDWDFKNFPEPKEMLRLLDGQGRKVGDTFRFSVLGFAVAELRFLLLFLSLILLPSISFLVCRYRHDTIHGAYHHRLTFQVRHQMTHHLTTYLAYILWEKVQLGFMFLADSFLLSKRAKYIQLVAIVDPHLAASEDYSVMTAAQKLDVLIKTPSGDATYVGHCWPGPSGWVDYTHPAAKEWWQSLFGYEHFKVSLLSHLSFESQSHLHIHLRS